MNVDYFTKTPTDAMKKMVGNLHDAFAHSRGPKMFDSGTDFWLIPDHDFMPKVLKHFGLSEEDFLLAFKTYAKAFAQLWKFRSTDPRFLFNHETKKITVRSEDPNKPDLVFTTRRLEGGPISFGRVMVINGFISNDHLNNLIKNYQKSKVPADWKKFKGTLHLHSSVLPKLYKELGVHSADEIFPTLEEYNTFNRKFHDYLRGEDSYLVTGQLKFKDGTIVDILDRNKSGYPDVSEMPDLLKRELRKNIENRKNPTGKLFPHKDIFDVVVPGFSGRDLILACNVDKVTNARCAANNFQVFRVKLREEFGLNYDENNYGYPDAKSLYMQMHTAFAYVTTELNGNRRFAWTRSRHPGFDSRTDAKLTIIPPLYIPARKGTWKPLKQFYVMDYLNDALGFDTLTIDWEDVDKTIPLRVTYNGSNDFLRTDEFLEHIRFLRTELENSFQEGLSILRNKPPGLIGFLYQAGN